MAKGVEIGVNSVHYLLGADGARRKGSEAWPGLCALNEREDGITSLRAATNGARFFTRIQNSDRRHFLELLQGLVEMFRVRLHACVLMPNHYHLLLEIQAPNLSEAIQWLNVSYAVCFNRGHGRRGHLFQGRFRSVLVEGRVGVGTQPLCSSQSGSAAAAGPEQERKGTQPRRWSGETLSRSRFGNEYRPCAVIPGVPMEPTLARRKFPRGWRQARCWRWVGKSGGPERGIGHYCETARKRFARQPA